MYLPAWDLGQYFATVIWFINAFCREIGRTIYIYFLSDCPMRLHNLQRCTHVCKVASKLFVWCIQERHNIKINCINFHMHPACNLIVCRKEQFDLINKMACRWDSDQKRPDISGTFLLNTPKEGYSISGRRLKIAWLCVKKGKFVTTTTQANMLYNRRIRMR